jgi:predicted P-loop ATPase
MPELRVGDAVVNPSDKKPAKITKILHDKARLDDNSWHKTTELQAVSVVPTTLPPQKSPRLKAEEYLNILTELGYEFSLNQMDDNVYVNGAMLTDVTAATIRSKMSDLGHTRFNIIEDAYTRAAQSRTFHPVTDYLSGLKWDGKNHILELTDKFVDADGMFPFFLRRWLIGAVAKAYTGTQTAMLVLDGAQGIGKSQFTKWLCPLPGMYLDSAIHPDNKDSLMSLITRWIWEVGELGNTTRRADRDALKNFLTMEQVTVRAPYGKHSIVKPALASFIGTINADGSGLLDDNTGNRRYVIVELTKIDWGYTALDIDAIWAEAVAAYNAGECWQLDSGEGKQADSIKDRYVIQDPLEDWILKYFEIDPEKIEDADWRVPTTDIIEILHNAGWRLGNSPKSESMAISAAMTALGAYKPGNKITVRGAQVRGYQCIKRRENNQPQPTSW